MANQSPQIRIVKKKKAHAAHHGGAWKVAYADFVTAMMAFFLVMWIVGLSQNVKESVAGYFQDPQGFLEAVKGGDAPFAVSEQGKKSESESEDGEQAIEREKLKEAKATIEKMVAATPEFKDLEKHIDIKLVNEGLKIDLLEEGSSLFFDAASAQVKPSARELLSKMAQELGKLPNKVIIEGHTDSRPLNRRDKYSNWELSADRSNSARRIMEFSGLKPLQIAQVRGYASTQPRDRKNPEHFSNRRVSIIVVLKSAMKKAQFDSGTEESTPVKKSDEKH